MFRSTMRVGLGALVVTVAVSLMSPSATAAPAPTPAPHAAPKVTPNAVAGGHTVTLSKGEPAAIKLARKATIKGQSGTRLDWKKAKKVFGKHTSLRDGYGAGVWGRRHDWKQFKNISKGDKKSIIKWAKGHPGPTPRPWPTSRRCTGPSPSHAPASRSTRPRRTG